MISEHLSEYYGLPVVDFVIPRDWKGSEFAYRIGIDWDSEDQSTGLLDVLLTVGESRALKALVIGPWFSDDSSEDCQPIIEWLAKHAPRLPHLEAIFLGDIVQEETEMSWIAQSDMEPLLRAFPNLVRLDVRGSNGLSFGTLEHAGLRHLSFENGGLDRSVVRQLSQSLLPNLEHLELWLGDQGYGRTASVEDLQPILTGELFPSLKYLGIRNTETCDEFVPTIVNSPLLNRIEVLDLSGGDLSDAGGRSLLRLKDNTSLKLLDLRHHYMSEALCEELKSLPMEVNVGEAQSPDDDWRPIYVSE